MDTGRLLKHVVVPGELLIVEGLKQDLSMCW